MEPSRSSSNKKGGVFKLNVDRRMGGKKLNEAFNVPLVSESTPHPRTNPELTPVSNKTVMMTEYSAQYHSLNG